MGELLYLPTIRHFTLCSFVTEKDLNLLVFVLYLTMPDPKPTRFYILPDYA